MPSALWCLRDRDAVSSGWAPCWHKCAFAHLFWTLHWRSNLALYTLPRCFCHPSPQVACVPRVAALDSRYACLMFQAALSAFKFGWRWSLWGSLGTISRWGRWKLLFHADTFTSAFCGPYSCPHLHAALQVPQTEATAPAFDKQPSVSWQNGESGNLWNQRLSLLPLSHITIRVDYTVSLLYPHVLIHRFNPSGISKVWQIIKNNTTVNNANNK